MSDSRINIKDFINLHRGSKKPLSDKSITAYTSTLLNLYSSVFGDAKLDFDKFNDYKIFLNKLKDNSPSSRKAKISALYSVSTDPKALIAYKNAMAVDMKSINESESLNKASDKQKEANLTQLEITNIGDQLKIAFDADFKKYTNTINPKAYKAYDKIGMSRYIIYLLTSGKYIPPRRLLDWTKMKVGKIDKRAKNTKLDYNIYNPTTGEVAFNVYKTASTMGTQYMKMPSDVKKYLNKYIKLNDIKSGDFLISDKDGEELSIPTFNKRLNTIYGDGRSVNVLRHSYISERYANISEMPTVKELTKTAAAMGQSSIDTHLGYIKR